MEIERLSDDEEVHLLLRWARQGQFDLLEESLRWLVPRANGQCASFEEDGARCEGKPDYELGGRWFCHRHAVFVGHPEARHIEEVNQETWRRDD